MIVALTGATGYVGRFIARDLAARGVTSRALIRGGPRPEPLPPLDETVTGDLTDPAARAALIAGADALIHSAYSHVPGRYRGGEGADLAGYLARNLTAALDLLVEARAAGVGRCVVLSSRAVYGARLPERPMDEHHPTWPDTHYGAHKVALEAFVSSFGQGEGRAETAGPAACWPICALRPTGVYGYVPPLARCKWVELIGAIRDGAPAPQPARAGSEVHGADVARSVWRLLTAPAGEIAGRCYNCSDLVTETREIAEIVQRLTGAAGPLPPPAPRPARAVMDTTRLESLGIAFGGRPRLEATIAEMLAAMEPAGEPAGASPRGAG